MEPQVHLTTPANYRHRYMKPFSQDQLASPEDYKYRGYIPVDHSMFQGDNTYDGTPIEENEDMPTIQNTPNFYIDEIEDEPETEPDHDFHTPPFQEEPKFFTEPVIRHTLEPRPIPQRPVTLNHIFHEPDVKETVSLPREVFLPNRPSFRNPQ